MPEQTLLYATVILYLGLLIGLGVVFQRLNKNTDDYFRSGARASWWLVALSIFASGISSKTFTANAGAAYEAGWSIWVDYGSGAVGSFLVAIFLAHRFRQARAITFAELVRERFGPVTQQTYAVFGIFLALLIGGMWLWGLSIFVSSVFGIEMHVLIIGLGLVVLLYSTTGGVWAVMATDFVQGTIMIIMSILLTVLCLKEIGGVGELLSRIQEAGLGEQYAIINSQLDPGRSDPYQYTAPWAAAMIVGTIFGHLSMGGAVKYFSVKTGRDARKAAVVTGLLLIFSLLVFFIPPITARLLYAEQVAQMNLTKPAEAAYAVASIQLLPHSLLGVMVVAMFAATMSSMDTALNRNAAFVIRDILPAVLRRFGKSMPDNRRQLHIGQLLTVVFGLLVICIALSYTQLQGLGVFEVALNITALAGLPMAVPLVMGLLVRRTPGWSALVTIFASLLPGAWAMIDSMFFDRVWPYHVKVFSVLPLGIAVFLCTRFFWRWSGTDERARINAFFQRMKTPVDFEAEVGQANDHLQLRMLGGAMLVVALGASLLLLVPQSGGDRLCVLAVVATLAAIGAGMYATGARRLKKRKQTA